MADHSVEISEDQAHKFTALVLHKLGVACPGPNAGMQLLAIVEQIDKVIPKLGKSPAVPLLQQYRDDLRELAGIWAHQQKLVIDKFEKFINRPAAPAGKVPK